MFNLLEHELIMLINIVIPAIFYFLFKRTELGIHPANTYSIKMPTILIYMYINRIYFMFSFVQKEKCFMTLGPDKSHCIEGVLLQMAK